MGQKNILSDDHIREIFYAVIGGLDTTRRIPVATYRLQFNKRFKFSDAKSIVSYLNDLGISDCYASPYFKAKKGSMHGYDIVDHNTINPEVGTEAEYEKFVRELKKYGMGQLLDIVPNHMSIADDENIRWMDVLENGPSSMYADYFDIDWRPVKAELENKVLLPILGDQYGQVLENQELHLSFEDGAFFVSYYDRKLPAAPISYLKILKYRLDEIEKKLGSEHLHFQELLSIITAIIHLPPRTEKNREKIMERRREKEIIKRRLLNLYQVSEEIRTFLSENIRIFNGEKGNPRSFDPLDNFLNDQAYRLTHWRVATEEINYRRFFDINELAAIKMENPDVFREAHKLVFTLIREGKVTGLRIDHIDGLYNPVEYLHHLQRSCFSQICLRKISLEPPRDEPDLFKKIEDMYDEEIVKNPETALRTPFYTVGEKILMRGERIPEEWPILGATGYGFLNTVNGIFVDTNQVKTFEDIYRKFIRFKMSYQDLIYENKKLIMRTSMPSEINMLGHYLNRLSEKDRHTRDFTLNSLITAVVEVIANFPVYRTYINPSGMNENDRRYIGQAVTRAKRRNPAMSATIFDFLASVLLLRYPETFREEDRLEWLDFTMRFQQVTGPVMAKGLEDTAFYVYNRFVSLNEVGGNPERFGVSLETFHGQNRERAKFWPYAMITTSTHDTKRSEDVRARLNVLSEIPEEWRQYLARWSRMNKKKKLLIDGQPVPDRNEEYLLYQTLIGAWPIEEIDEREYGIFIQRIKDYLLKALREAKVNTSWISPNVPYEQALWKFVDNVLTPNGGNRFLKTLESFQKRVSYFGMFNSLSQTLLKITVPGMPDFYQGTEIWDLSLVDPDNRRLVDYDRRKKMLKALKRRLKMSGPRLSGFTKRLIQSWKDGQIKLFVTYRALNYRRENHPLFMDGSYIPLAVDGDLKEHICTFARRKEDTTVIVAVPRFLTRLVRRGNQLPLGERVWKDSGIILPDDIHNSAFLNLFTHETISVLKRNDDSILPLKKVFTSFPVTLLVGEL